MDGERARLRWRCRRGMRELDLVTTEYLDTRYDDAAPDEQAAFRRLLDLPDPELFGYLTGREVPSDPGISRLVDDIRSRRFSSD